MNSNDESPKRLLLTTVVWLFGTAILAVLLLWAFLGRSVVEKVVSDAVMPLGLICLALLALTIDAFRRRHTVQWKLLAIVFAIVFTASNQMVAKVVIRTLEGRYHDIDPLAGSAFGQVVLLGGATGETAMGNVQVNQNGDRVVMAARMYHRGLAGKIYCSGEKTASIGKFRGDEAEHAKRLLVDLGVPVEAIEEIGGRNTSEEMQTLVTIVGDDPVGIITSAWHMPRAIRLAQASGINAQPVPCGFLSGANHQLPLGAFIRDCVPNGGALRVNSIAAHEYLAALVGR